MGLDKNIARVEKLDEHTVKFTLNEVDAAFIQNLAMPFPSIQSAEYAAQLLKQGKASDINQKPIGTGPFVFSRYQKDAQIRFKGNKDYWIMPTMRCRTIWSHAGARPPIIQSSTPIRMVTISAAVTSAGSPEN